MIKIKDSIVWGIYVYEFNLKLNTNSVPYQLTFERDFYHPRTNVHLLNLFGVEDNDSYCSDTRLTIFECFKSFFNANPDEIAYFELDMSHKRNFYKFMKFFRWAECFPDYTFSTEFTDIANVKYAMVSISKNKEEKE
jgi:hypothetical protein